jgi:tetratricopeptide (TPR) repeat protein
MDIYAQMNNAKMRKGNDPKELDKGIQNLVKLTRKDNFEKYRDILFYAAGELALVKPDTAQAVQLYIKSYQNNESNVTYKNKAFIRLGDIAYEQRKYQQAYNYYDSLQNGDTTLTETIANIQARRTALSKIVERLAIIHREDSLQRIALLPEAERIAFVKKLSKKLRKAKGLNADDSFDQGPMLDFANKTSEPTDLFASSKNSGEWYFYNASIKSKGFSEFKRKWGTRTNTDNWRRKNASSNANSASSQNSGLPGGGLGNMNPDDIDAAPVAIADPKKGNDSKDGQSFDNYGGRNKNLNGNSTESTNGQEEDLSFEGLMSHLPLTPEAMTNSINLHASNLFYLAKLYQNELEDYQIAIETYDSSLLKFPDSLYNGEIHFGMFYCYTKLGNTAKANYYKNILNTNFRDSKSTKMLNNPAALAKPGEKTKEGTNRYQAIYNLFIEGNFQAALQEKIKADSIFGNQYWSPQLLYIEAVYHVKQKNDSIAKDVLGKIISLYPKSKLKPRAEKLIDVLNRRIEIESYLTKLEVKRYPEDSMTVAPERVKLVRNDNNLIRTPKSLPDSLKNIVQPLNKGIPVVSDSGLIVKNAISGPYQFVHANTHQVIMVLDKVDGTYINEGKNAMTRYVGSNFGSQNITISRDAIDNTLALIVFSSFADANEALQFLQKIRRAAPDEISWLPANKYYFILIDSDNLVRMKNSKDLNGYKALLKQQFPSAF